ncbi:cytochrome P450 [Lentithecium fluviatile CBS 122367]|uniref:Cytochrome P450 n=1 Tax=Lentithecium fluviatile CBS 122367 TaxID=1168545 RepID=A0A6G1IDP1_9PLEO|nr:cytochrome P450 [Lentithecium fluviatile CBS 122367]
METSTLKVVTFLLFSSWVLWIINTHFQRWRERRTLIARHVCRTPPTPAKSDPFGLVDMRESTAAYHSKTLLQRTCEQYDQYGKTWTSRFMTQRVIHTIEPENIKAVLSTNFYDYGVGWRRKHAFRPLLGGSLFQIDGHAWAKSRAVIQPAFTRARITDVGAWEGIVESFLERVMDASSDKRTVDLAPYFFKLATDLASSFIRGKSTIDSEDSEKKEENDFLTAMKYAGGGCEKRWQLGMFTFLFPMKDFYRQVATVHGYMEKQVDDVLAVQDAEDFGKRRDFLASLTERTKDRKVLRDEACMLFVAAADTTGCLLTNLFFLLGRYEEVWKKLREEAAAFGKEKPTAQDLKKLKYHVNCIREALRVLPILPSNSREAYKDTVLPVGGGPDGNSPVFVPAGSVVSFSIMAMQRRKDLWGDDAEEFRPERWDNVQPGTNWAYIPFMQGPRICLGNELAMLEVTYIVVKMVQRFERLDRVDKDPWIEEVSIGTTSANGVKAMLVPDETYSVGA